MAGTDPGGDLRGARATPEPIKFQKKKKKKDLGSLIFMNHPILDL